MSLLEVSGIEVVLDTPNGPVRAVRGVGFALQRGETLGIVGESGCGKTMTALALMGLLPEGARVEGGIRFDGADLLAGSEDDWCRIRGNRIAMVFQEPMSSLNPLHTVGRQVAEGLILHRGLGRGGARREARRLLDRVGIEDAGRRLNHYPHQLSGGQRQRVMIAMALANEPDLLIADEPTTALDVTIQKQILDLIGDLVRDLGMGLVLISHDLAVIANTVDRIVVMYGGAVVESAPVRERLAHLSHPYTRGLLSGIPQVGHDARRTGRRLESIPGTVPELFALPSGCTFADRCELAEPACRGTPPELVPVGRGHVVACRRVDAARERWRTGSDESGRGRSQCRPRPHRRGPAHGRERGGAVRECVDGAEVRRPASAGDTALLVEARDLHKEYLLPRDSLLEPPRRVHALRGVSFDLRAGCNLGVVGESGCGKSTLARAVMGLEAPTRGRVRVLGTDVMTVDDPRRRHLRRSFQMVFQDPFGSLDPRRKVGRIVAEPLALERLGREESRTRVVQVLEAVGLKGSDTDKYPHEFSGGQRQRIAIARALVTRPALIVADEPVSALDVSVQAQVLNLLEDLREAFGVTYMLISHDLAVVQYVCEEVMVMNAGIVVEHGRTDDIFTAPRHDYTRMLLDAVLPLPEIG